MKPPYKERGSFCDSTAALTVLQAWWMRRQTNDKRLASSCKEKAHVRRIWSAQLTWATHRKKSVCVCLHRHKRTFVTIRHRRWMTSPVPLWDCREVGLDMCLCVCVCCCFECLCVICYRVSHEKKADPHQLTCCNYMSYWAKMKGASFTNQHLILCTPKNTKHIICNKSCCLKGLLMKACITL